MARMRDFSEAGVGNFEAVPIITEYVTDPTFPSRSELPIRLLKPNEAISW
jgi:hypothetical protein